MNDYGSTRPPILEQVGMRIDRILCSLPFRRVLVVTAWACAGHELSAQVTIDTLPIPPGKQLATLQLRGYRALDVSVLQDYASEELPPGIAADLFTQSARKATWLHRYLPGSPETATLSDWYGAACSASAATLKRLPETEPTWLTVHDRLHDSAIVDANLIAGLPSTELFDCESSPRTRMVTFHGQSVEWLEGDMAAYTSLKNFYSYVLDAETAPSPMLAFAAASQAYYSVNATPLLTSTTLYNAGTVSVGSTTVWTAQEANWDIPDGIAKTHDVYVIQFVFTVADNKDITNITFLVDSTNQAVAIELQPLNYEKKEDELLTQFGPAIPTGGLPPTVVASGLGESVFWWELREAATRPGSKKVVAGIKVPKETTNFTAVLRISGRQKRFFSPKPIPLFTERFSIVVPLKREARNER